MVQIVHTADFHLDPRMTNFLNKDEERREDFLKNFDEIINFTLEEKPDLLLISGDIFDSINPRNPIRYHVISQFKKLFKQKIKIFAITGNHDSPKSIHNAMSPVSILDSIDYLDLIQAEGEYIGKRELSIGDIKLNILGNSYNIFCTSEQDPLEQRIFPKLDGDINLLLVHESIGLFKHSYLGDSIIKEVNIPEEIDYVAAGHIHEHMERSRDNINTGNVTHLIYPGSIEYLSFNENFDNPKGFLFLEFDKHELISKEFIKLQTRPIKKITLSISKTDVDIYQKIVDNIQSLKDKNLILKIILEGKIKVDQITSIKSNKIIDFGDEFFFKLFLDSFSKLAFEASELTLPDKEHITPKEIFIHYVDQLMKKEVNKETIRLLDLAKIQSINKLEKFGVE